MSETVTGAMLIAVPILFNVGFTLLAQRFNYPDVLRQPTHEVLERFRQGGSSLLLIWWGFALSAVLFAPLAVLLAGELGDADRTVVALSAVVGVLASVVQFLGLIRWPFLVPYRAREADSAARNSTRADWRRADIRIAGIGALAGGVGAVHGPAKGRTGDWPEPDRQGGRVSPDFRSW